MSDFKENIYIVANFGELFLKGKNISFFEKKLFNNLSEKLGNLKKDLSFERKSGGSFHIKLSPGLEEQRILEIEEIIKSTPGIINFFRAYACPTNLEEISEAAVFLAQGELEKRPTIETFGIRAERIEKEAEYSSQELGKEVGSAVWQVIEKDVNLDNPDLEIFIKERKNQTFIFVDKKEAVGGMPVGSSGQALVFYRGE